MKNYELITLSNGIRVVHKQVKNTKVAHCGFVLDIGSRDETPDEQGLAHFWEHMAFKGTKKRRAFHILNRLDAVGGDLNAYTTKEKIYFHASVLSVHFEKAIELLSDITFNSTFPEKEIRKERGVILEEMAMYFDDPADAIYDQFDEVIFGDHPLGKNILGTSKSIQNFTQNHFFDFIRNNLDTNKLVFSAVTNLPLAKVRKLAEKYFAETPTFQANHLRKLFTNYQSSEKTETKSITQAHQIMGAIGYPLKHPKRLPLFLLINLLGGVGMTSRLNMTLREKFGLVYSVEANYIAYQDTGLFSIYFGTDKHVLERCKNLVMKELQKLQNKPLGVMQLQRTKRQVMGQLAMSEENNLSEMLMMGRSILNENTVESLDETFEKIERITALELQEIAQEMFEEKRLSFLTYLPK